VRRTLAVSVAAAASSLGVVIGAGARGELLTSAGLWLGGFAACATITSKVVFGLRQEIQTARRIGAYVLHEKLGEGGMGVVYRATHALLKRETAVKLVHKNHSDSLAVARFEREVVLTAKLTHPNTVAVFDYGRTPEGEFYYAMEYLEGLTLQELVERCGPLSPGRAIAILTQVCGSLEEAHRLGLVHRDIKPANIMVTCRASVADLVKVLDFGLVKDFENPSAALSTGGLVGTPPTMSPEAITHPGSIGPSSDLYSLGAVAYFLLTGTQVFDGETLVAVCAQHLYKRAELPSQLASTLPSDLASLVLALLEKDPAGRPASAAEVRARLTRCQDAQAWSEDEATLWWRDVGEPAMRDRERLRRTNRASGAGRTLSIDTTIMGIEPPAGVSAVRKRAA